MSARAHSAAIWAFFIGEAEPAEQTREAGRGGCNPMLLQKPSREVRHGDVGLLLHLLDQKGLIGRQLAAAVRSPLPHRSRRSAPLLVLDELDRKALAHAKPPGRSASGMALSDKGSHALAKVHRVAASHDPPPRRSESRQTPAAIPRLQFPVRRSSLTQENSRKGPAHENSSPCLLGRYGRTLAC